MSHIFCDSLNLKTTSSKCVSYSYLPLQYVQIYACQLYVNWRDTTESAYHHEVNYSWEENNECKVWSYHWYTCPWADSLLFFSVTWKWSQEPIIYLQLPEYPEETSYIKSRFASKGTNASSSISRCTVQQSCLRVSTMRDPRNRWLITTWWNQPQALAMMMTPSPCTPLQ